MFSTCLDIVIIIYVEIIDFPCIHRLSMMKKNRCRRTFEAQRFADVVPRFLRLLLIAKVQIPFVVQHRIFGVLIGQAYVERTHIFLRKMKLTFFLNHTQSAHRQRFCLVLI
jgi:hypothetical protein